MKHLLCLLLVCKIFSWGAEGPNGVTPEINEWLKGKSIVKTEQSSITRTDGWVQTYLTIIAEG